MPRFVLQYHPTTTGIPIGIVEVEDAPSTKMKRIICYFKNPDGSLGDATMEEARKMCEALNEKESRL